MKRSLVFLFVILALLGVGLFAWFIYTTKTPVLSNQNQDAASFRGQHLLFTINTQEFIYTEESISILTRILDLHEQHQIPVDVYLNHASLQTLEEHAPDLLQRLVTSPVVAVSYHMRPPLPYFRHFDFLGLSTQPESEIRTTIEQYETHAIDFTTGLTTEEPGGYQHLKDILGYAPPIVGLNTEPEFAQIVLQVYANMGASFVVEHRDTPIRLGETKFNLPIRPEDKEIILTEYTGQPCSNILSEAYTEVRNQKQAFVNVKVHDNDFIATRSAWLSVYLPNNRPASPPFDLSLGETNRELLTEEEQNTFWNQYAGCVAYAAEHPEQFIPMNAFDLQEYLEGVDTETSASPAQPSSQVGEPPVIYASVVTHVEEPGATYPNFVEDEEAFWEYHVAILKFATLLHERGIPYNFQSDWNFLLAIQEHDQGSVQTNGKNLVKYLYEDLGVEIDPHAHQTTHNYADVAYLIEQLGVAPTHTVGGYLVFPLQRSELNQFYAPISGDNYDYTWQAEILWGGGSPNHTQDYTISGVWKPKSADAFTEHSDQAALPAIGTYTSDWDGLNTLIQQAKTGDLEEGEIYTATVMANSSVFLSDSAQAEFATELQTLQDEIEAGEVQFVHLSDVIDIWQTEFQSEPNIYQVSAESTEAPEVQKNGNCGNGVCEAIEQQLNKCPEDCK